MKQREEKKRKFDEIISQCPGCKLLTILTPDGRKQFVSTHCVFPLAPKEECFSCKSKIPSKPPRPKRKGRVRKA